MNLSAPRRQFSDYLLEVQTKLAWDHSEMADLLKVTGREWKKIAAGDKEPSLMALSAFAESTDVDLEKLFEQKLDLNVLQLRQLAGNLDALPEEYLTTAFSRVRTSRYLLDYVEFNFGWRLRSNILKRLEMNESAIADPERWINIKFYMDICEALKQLGYDHRVMQKMGEFSVHSNRSGAVGQAFSDCKTPTAVYEKLVPTLGTLFEKNHRYRILSLGPNHCTIESTDQQEVAHGLKLKLIGSREVCAAKAGVASSFAHYAGNYSTQVEQLECVHQGDQRCVYHVTWKPIKQLSVC
jgi:hypothetical protein